MGRTATMLCCASTALYEPCRSPKSPYSPLLPGRLSPRFLTHRPSPYPRGMSRGGGRGGRGGRGGPGRGGAARGSFSRGAHNDSNGRHSKVPASQSPDNVPAKRSDDASPAEPTPLPDSISKPADDHPTDSSAVSEQPASDNATWSTPTPPTWAGENGLNGSSTHPQPSHPPPPAKHLSKTPATSKLSFAQVARYATPSLLFSFSSLNLMKSSSLQSS